MTLVRDCPCGDCARDGRGVCRLGAVRGRRCWRGQSRASGVPGACSATPHWRLLCLLSSWVWHSPVLPNCCWRTRLLLFLGHPIPFFPSRAGSNWGNKDLADLDFGNGDEDSSDSGEEN